MNLPVPYTFANGDGTTTNFPLTFPYLSKDHIKVGINGILTTSFTWINSSTIQITPAPSIGVNNVKIYRDTPHNDKLVSFAGNVSLRPSDLETDSLQVMYILQELEELLPSDEYYTRANGAFDQANVATTNADAAFTRANASYANANTAIYTAAQIRANITNTAPVNYDATSGTISHADSGVTATTYGNSTFVSQVTVDAKGHVTNVSNVAIDQTLAQSSFTQANAAYTQANTKVSKSGDTMTGTLITPTVLASNVGIGGVSPSLAILQANGDIYTTAGLGFYQTGDGGARNVFYRGGTDFTVLRNYNQPYTIFQIWSPPGTLGSGDKESTLALVRGNEPDQEFIDVYNNGYASETQFGIRIQKRGTGVYRDFVFDQYDGTTKTPIMNLTSSGAVVIGSDPGGSEKLRVNGTVNISSTVSAADPITTSHLTTKSWVDTQVASKVANSGVTVNGSILIGNTVSGGFDLRTLTQGTGIVITNDKGSITIAATGGGAGSVENTFSIINVAGQSNIVADSNTDTLTLIAGSGMTITTDAPNDTITFTATGGGGGSDQFARDQANAAFDKANGAFSSSNTKVANSGVTVNGSILIGNTVSGGYDLNTLTQGTGIVITNDKGSITIAATGGYVIDQFARDTANGISRCITVPSPVVTDNISFFFTDKPITFTKVVSVVRGTSTPNVTFLLSYESSRHVGATRTNIIDPTVCSNTTNGVFTTTFANTTVPANNYVTLTFSTVSGTVNDIHISMFGSM